MRSLLQMIGQAGVLLCTEASWGTWPLGGARWRGRLPRFVRGSYECSAGCRRRGAWRLCRDCHRRSVSLVGLGSEV